MDEILNLIESVSERFPSYSDAYISHVSMAMTGVFVSTDLKSLKLSQE